MSTVIKLKRLNTLAIVLDYGGKFTYSLENGPHSVVHLVGLTLHSQVLVSLLYKALGRSPATNS